MSVFHVMLKELGQFHYYKKQNYTFCSDCYGAAICYYQIEYCFESQRHSEI